MCLGDGLQTALHLDEIFDVLLMVQVVVFFFEVLDDAPVVVVLVDQLNVSDLVCLFFFARV